MHKLISPLVRAALALSLAPLIQLVTVLPVHAARPEETAGIPWTGAAGVRESNRDIMEREARGRQVGRLLRVKKHGHIEFALYVDPSELPAEETVKPGPQLTSAAQSVALNFLGATLADTLAYPPDSMGAVGPSQYIVAVNGRIRSFNKHTGAADGILNADTDTFFGSVMTPTAVNFTSDPRIRYDRLSQRWFVIMLDVPNGTGATPNRIMIAVSDGPVLTSGGSWTFYQFQHDLVTPTGDTGKFADYPTLGIDANALYIGVNVFGTRGQGSFDNTTAFVVRKSSLLGGGPLVVTAFRGLVPNGNAGGPYTPQGVDNFDPNATEGYLIGVNSRFYGKLSLRRISDPGGTPAISAVINFDIPLNGGTIKVPHLGNTGGTAGYLDGLDYRLMAAHIRNGRLWTSANIAVDNTGSPSGTDTRMGVRWWELDGITTGQTPAIVQSGTLFESSPGNTASSRHYWMGSIMISGQGHAAVGFSAAGESEYANAGTAGRLAGDAPGTLRPPVLYTASTSAYNPRDSNNNPINRWGDYSYTCVDPDDDMTMWTIQQYTSSPNYYGVRVAKLLAPGPAAPLSCSPGTLTNGVANVIVTLLGASDGDTGFFDPGAGFSNRLAAVVGGGGVTVNSITYNNPTNLTLNLSVGAGAAAGARVVTVTNPDGQGAASLGGILTIVNVGSSNLPPSLPGIADQTVIEETLLTFTNSASDPDGNSFTYSLLGAPNGAMIGASSGVFTWTPTEAQGPGSNVMSVVVADNGVPSLSATQTFTVFVLETNSAPTLAVIADRVVHAGTLIQFTNGASDADLPSNGLIFSLQAGAPGAAGVNPGSGVFTWQTADVDANTTNGITVLVTDDGLPNLNASRTFTATVLARPVIQAVEVSNSVVILTWSAIPGQGYRLQTNASLDAPTWGDVGADVIAPGPIGTASDVANSVMKLYRIRVMP